MTGCLENIFRGLNRNIKIMRELTARNMQGREILAIYCAGGVGREVLDLARSVDRWERIIFVDDETTQKSCHGAEVYRFFEIEQFRDRIEFVIANGEPKARSSLYQKLKIHGYPMTRLIAQNGEISPSSRMGEGCIIFPGRLSPDVRIGDNVLIESGAEIGHDACIGSHCVLNSMSFIGGYVNIGMRTYIAPGALLRDRITVGGDAIIGLGAVVIHDMADRQIVAGNPARVIGENMEGKVFRQRNHNGGRNST